MMTKNRIILANFGTTDSDGQRVYASIERSVSCAFPNFEVVSAFTCSKFCSNQSVFIKNAFKQAASDNVSNLIIQPTHLMCGTDFANLLQMAMEWCPKFNALHVGRPLLDKSCDAMDVAKCLTSVFRGYPAVVLMGHGSKQSENSEYKALENAFASLGCDNFHIALLNGAPSLTNVRKRLKTLNVKNVLLAPLTLVAGVHAKTQMTGLSPNSFESILKQDGYETTCFLHGLGELPQIHEIYIRHIEQITKKDR